MFYNFYDDTYIQQSMVWQVQRYKLIQIGQPGLALPNQTVLARLAIYRKTPVQSGAHITVYIHTINCGLTSCLYYIFCTFLLSAPGLALSLIHI